VVFYLLLREVLVLEMCPFLAPEIVLVMEKLLESNRVSRSVATVDMMSTKHSTGRHTGPVCNNNKHSSLFNASPSTQFVVLIF
jgi:hypothetical protein